MKQLIIYFLLIIVSSCNGQDKNFLKAGDYRIKTSNSEFISFLNLFQTKNLPFSINCRNDYLRREIFDQNTSEHKANIFESVKKEDYRYLHDGSVNKQNIDFRYAFNLKEVGEFYCIIYIKDSLDVEGFADPSWLILNTYTLNGDFINKLRIAGDNFDVIDMFCEINNEREVIITSYSFLPDTQCSENYTCAKKEENKYKITDEGEIEQISSNEKKVIYKVDEQGCYEEIN